VENRLHRVQDISFDEVRSQVRTRNDGMGVAALRNLVIKMLRLTGVINIAAALRYQARRPDRTLKLLMIC
jgi:hypothetical protein